MSKEPTLCLQVAIDLGDDPVSREQAYLLARRLKRASIETGFSICLRGKGSIKVIHPDTPVADVTDMLSDEKQSNT